MNSEQPFFEQDATEMEARLWAYIDGLSEESSVIEQLIAKNKAWQEKYAELMDLHGTLAFVELEQPSLRFAKNVMEEIARTQITPAAKAYINTKIIWGIAAFFITVIVGFLVYGLSQIDWQASASGNGLGGVRLDGIDYSKMFNNSLLNGFMMLNIVLGLFLLDRYLNMKRKKAMGGPLSPGRGI